MNSLLNYKTYDLVKLARGKKALKNKWVFRQKQDGGMINYKSHLGVKDFI